MRPDKLLSILMASCATQEGQQEPAHTRETCAAVQHFRHDGVSPWAWNRG